jgi:hypothetical protein
VGIRAAASLGRPDRTPSLPPYSSRAGADCRPRWTRQWAWPTDPLEGQMFAAPLANAEIWQRNAHKTYITKLKSTGLLVR